MQITQQLNWTARTEAIHSPKEQHRVTKQWHEQTAKKHFSSESNPHELVRCSQKDKYVWYATYDEEMCMNKFLDIIHSCKDKGAPLVNLCN